MKIHLMGIGGVGMAGLAFLLKARGHDVSGCDLYASPRTQWLENCGIGVKIGHDPSHLDGIEQLVTTPAVNANVPEFSAAIARGIKNKYRGQVLAQIVGQTDSIAICGSHGKTTTATWTAKLLAALGDDPSWCIGGETGSFPVAHAGNGPLVVEADESDGTLALYHAGLLVVTNCEYDHPDHFKSAAEYRACYDTAIAQAKTALIAEELKPQSEITAAWWKNLAAHNQRNALAAMAVACERGHTPAAILAAMPAIVTQLPDRRFELIADGLYTDYAHHPTEIRCALEMAKAICKAKLRVIFQPHRYSRTKALINDFATAFDGVDELILCPTYAAFEKPIAGGDVTDLHLACRQHAKVGSLHLAPTCQAAWALANDSRASGDITLILGAGDLLAKVKAALAHPS